MDVRGAREWLLRGYSGFGVILGVAFVIASLSPSLLPTTWYVRGAIAGLLAALGYGIGVLLAWAARKVAGLLGLTITVGDRQRRGLQVLLVIGVASSFLWTTIANIRSEGVTAQLVGLKPLSFPQWIGACVLIVLMGGLFINLGRLVRRAYRRLESRTARFIPQVAATIVAVVVVTLVTSFITGRLVVGGVIDLITRSATSANEVTSTKTRPTSPLVTGGPGSPVTWDSLGFEGQNFTAMALTPQQIEQVNGRPAKQPIRVYAGLRPDGDLDATAATVVAELKRTKAFDRKVLAVYTTTGTGWVNEWSAQSFEALADGDCAIAAMQYSVLPSYVAFVVDRETPVAAGKALFDAVYAEWSRLPADHRPQLVVSGESLGAYGANGAFTDVQDMQQRAQGGVFSGTPSFTANLRGLFTGRLQGSPQISPVIDNGTHVRFPSSAYGQTADYVGRPFGAWDSPRFVYLQHPSDPVVWWSPSLMFDQPDWLREPRGRDVNPTMRWYPLVTFWQVTGDMAVGVSPGFGHGHKYGREYVGPWASVLGLDPGADWDAYADTLSRSSTIRTEGRAQIALLGVGEPGGTGFVDSSRAFSSASAAVKVSSSDRVIRPCPRARVVSSVANQRQSGSSIHRGRLGLPIQEPIPYAASVAGPTPRGGGASGPATRRATSRTWPRVVVGPVTLNVPSSRVCAA